MYCLGCGFYGSPATDNLCSICYKEALKKKQQPPSDARPSVSSQQSVAGVASFTTASPSFNPMPAPSSSMDTAQPTVPALPQTSSSSSELLSKDVSHFIIFDLTFDKP